MRICLGLRKSALDGAGLRSKRIDLMDRAGLAFIRPGGPPIFANRPRSRKTNAGCIAAGLFRMGCV